MACVLIGYDMISIGGVCGSSRRSWRPLIGAIAAFAVAGQTLLITFGLTLPARADVGISTFELCQHDAQGAPRAPTGDPAAAACAHCILCFAGSLRAVHYAATITVAGGVFFLVFIAEPAFRNAGDDSRLRAAVRPPLAWLAWVVLY